MIYLLIPLLMYATWIFYLAILKLKDVQDAGRFTPVSQPLAWLTLLLGLWLDFTLNLVMSVIMLDFMKFDPFQPFKIDNEYLLTPHVSRLLKTKGNSLRERWARGWAKYICKHFLVPADPAHCDER